MPDSTIKPIRYTHRSAEHNLKAPEVIVPLLTDLFMPASVIDIGCGIGTFLIMFEKRGVSDILGIDGEWVNPDKLYISKEKFKVADLSKPLILNRKFDLVLCLEVAEHIEEDCADELIDSLIGCGDIIVFSAAVKNQRGQNHLNEQPHHYWQKKFLDRGFVYYDLLRPMIWEDQQVNIWYKQNMFLVANKSILFNETISRTKVDYPVRTYIHPDLLQLFADETDRLMNENQHLLQELHTAMRRQNIFYATGKTIRKGLRKIGF